MHAYNISNPNSVSTIKELAKAYAKAGNKKIVNVVPTEKEKKGYNLMNNSSLKADSLLDLGWKGEFDLETGTKHTIEILKDIFYNYY